ncbi:MAG: TonB-dependent receptor [Bacteroidia bacterium]
MNRFLTPQLSEGIKPGNGDGFLRKFSLEGICEGQYALSCSHINCEHKDIVVDLKKGFRAHIHLETRDYVTEEVQILDVKIAPKPTQPISVIDQRALEELRGKNLGESLSRMAGVSILQTGATIAKPVIHGLHSNRLLILNNGIRQEGQQWGSEHAPEIDPFIATSLKVIKGANAVRYGSGAMAGVILVEPGALRDSAGIGGEINLVGFSNGRSGTVSGILEGSSELLPNWAWRVQGTVKKAGNLHTPDYYLENTGAQEDNFSLTLGYHTLEKGMEVYYSRFHNELGILASAHLGGESDLIKAFESPQPLGADTIPFTYEIQRPYQDITHHLLKWNGYLRLAQKGKVSLTYAYQNNQRLEFDKHKPRGSNDEGDIPELDFQIHTHTLEGVWDWGRARGWSGSVGSFGMYQDNYLNGRPFIPNFVAINGSAFAIQRWKGEKLEWEGGLRYDYNWMNSAREERGIDIYSIRSFQNISGTIGGLYYLNEKWNVKANLGSAWRPPHVDELFSNGLHHGAAAVQYGDSTLVPETAFKGLATLTYSGRKLQGELTFYHNHFNHFIYLRPDGLETTIRGTFPVFTYYQTQARLTGADLEIHYQFLPDLLWEIKGSWLNAYNQTDNEPLIYMPANWLENELTYEWKLRYKPQSGVFFIRHAQRGSPKQSA